MKKVKVTRRPKTSSDFILRPDRLRIFLIYAILFALAYGIGMLIRLVFSPDTMTVDRLREDWLLDLAIVVGGALLLSLIDHRRWTLRLQNGDRLEGPTGAFGERVIFPVEDIDWTRTGRSFQSRVRIGNGIYSITRQRILISPWFYNPGDFDVFLDRIGYSG